MKAGQAVPAIGPNAVPPYSGEGQLIAIIGSGADAAHPDFVLSDLATAKYDQTQMQAKILELGLTGVFFNDKVPYVYDYKDVDTDIVDILSPSNGTHVAGLAAANGDPLTAGAVGVAPEAQLLIMKVFGDDGLGTTSDVYIKAIEDAVLLGADSISLGLGTPSGSLTDVGAITTAAIQKAADIGSLVNIAGGDAGHFGFTHALPDAKSPDYGVISAPAIAPKAFAVASSSSVYSLDPASMSDFSSWGVTPDGDLKPEITAPGSDVWSTNDVNSYAQRSGTEIATAQISGGVALLSQRLKLDDPSGRGLPSIRAQAIKNTLMNTAKPHVDPTNSILTSPRKQGAGIMDITAALASDVTIVNNQNEAKLSLKNINDTFTLNTVIRNYGATAVTYNVRTIVTTDEVVGGKMTLKPRFLKDVPGVPVTVQPNSSTPLSIEVNVSEFSAGLLEQMPNGYFLEGFILLEHDALPDLSLPFTGFRGKWLELPILENFIYDYANLDVDKPIYYDEDSYDFTHFGTWLEGTYFVIGETPGITGRSFDKNLLGVSPNNDSWYDEIMLTGVFLRNFKNVQVNIYETGGTVPIYTSPLNVDPMLNQGAKNHFSGDAALPKSHYWPEWMWDGMVGGVPAVDGNYVIEVVGALNADSAPLQTYRYDMKVDTIAPKVTALQWVPATGRLILDVADPNGIGIYNTELTDGVGVIIDKNPGGYYELPVNADLTTYNFYSEDELGNYLEVTVSNIMPNVTRIQGKDRYQTAAMISSSMMAQSNVVVLASGQNYPDALSGIAYAAEINAPMLLTRVDVISQYTLAEIDRLNATQVKILGGTSAISQAVEDQLTALGLTVTRIKGSDRYKTAVQIGENMARVNKKVFLASGLVYADAISIGAASAIDGTPVLLTKSTILPDATRAALISWGTTEVTILGGTAAISQGIQDSLVTMGIKVSRIGGLNRYVTNYNINKAYFTNPTMVYVASGEDYPDALTGSLLAAFNNTTNVLTKTASVTPSLTTYLSENPINKIVILGGPSAVSDAVMSNINQLLLLN